MVIGLGTLVVAIAVMGLSCHQPVPLIFVLYPLLMLVDWMLGLFGSSIALCCACVLAVFLTEHGYGPFANTQRWECRATWPCSFTWDFTDRLSAHLHPVSRAAADGQGAAGLAARAAALATLDDSPTLPTAVPWTVTSRNNGCLPRVRNVVWRC